jgi:signal peptidase I
VNKGRVQEKVVPKAEDSSPPDRRSLRDARRFKKESETLLKKHQKKLTPEQRERVQSAIRAVEEAVEKGKAGGKRQLAGAVKDLDQAVDDVLGFAKKSGTREFLESITVAILIAAVLRAFVIEAFKIPSGSMIPTLEVGDHIFVNKFIYGLRIPLTNSWLVEWGTPQRGDVIVFRFPRDISKDYIKRVVAVEGDRIRVEQRDVYVNDQKLDRDNPTPYSYWEDAEPGESIAFDGIRRAYAFPEKSKSDPPKLYTVLYSAEEVERAPFPHGVDLPGLDCKQPQPTQKGECVILPGYAFVMGDNRDNSSDGRAWGGVPISYVKGKAMFVWWSRGERSGIRFDRLFRWID